MQLQKKLLLGIIPAVAASLLILGWIANFQLQQNSHKEQKQKINLVLTQIQQDAESFIATTKANAKLFASSVLIENYVLAEDETERYSILQPALLKLFSSYQNAYPAYQEIRLLQPDGYEDTRLAPLGFPNMTDDESQSLWFKELVKHTITGLLYSKISASYDDGNTKLLVAYPLWIKAPQFRTENAKRNLKGYLVVTADLNFLQRKIDSLRLGKEGYLVALDNSGKVLFHPDKSEMGNDWGTIRRTYALQKTENSDASIKWKGNQLLMQGRWIHKDILLLAVLPETEFIAASKKLSRTVAGFTIGAILISSTILLWIIRFLVIGPITTLRKSAIDIGDGQWDNQIDIHRNDEIGDLANAFREMGAKLSTTIGDLKCSRDELQTSYDAIEQLAHRDTLTGLPNRRLFLGLVAAAIKDASTANSKLAIMFLDLDNFKKVNDTVGHEAGDLLLQEVSERLKACIRDDDNPAAESDEEALESINPVARLGGDEFTVMLSSIGDAESAIHIARLIIKSLTKPVILGDQEFTVGTSIGISMYPSDATDVETLVKYADLAMYEAKNQNKNTYRLYNNDMKAAIESRISIEKNLRSAMDNNELEMLYQLQFHNITREVAGVEALVKWHNPEKGMIDPDQITAVAEETGIINDIGKWRLMEACRQWQVWNDCGIAPGRITVSVSQRQFGLCDMARQVKDALQINSMDPAILQLDMTESSMMDSTADVLQTLRIICDMGVGIAMSRFGSGSSSLSGLTRLPINTLKIDHEFIANIKPLSGDDDVVSALLTLASTLKLQVVAEGIDTESELNYMIHQKFDVIQGAQLSKPMTAKALTDELARRTTQDLICIN